VLDFARFTAVTFDCYGTLIDWETGIVEAVRPMLERHGVVANDDEILEAYASLESKTETGPYRAYRSVLRLVAADLSRGFGFEPSVAETMCLEKSLGAWPPFSDTVISLTRMKERYRLGVISNIDEDLFEQTAARLGVAFDWMVTAERAQAYKPSTAPFRLAFEAIGAPPDRILHVAQSIYHDIVPARELGLAVVWVNRRGGRAGFGATPPAHAEPDLEVPDLATLVTRMGID